MTEIAPRYWLTGREAAEYLAQKHGICANHETLARYRHFGCGPQFELRGRWVRYSKDAIDAWVKERSSAPVRSTAEARRLQKMKASAAA